MGDEQYYCDSCGGLYGYDTEKNEKTYGQDASLKQELAAKDAEIARLRNECERLRSALEKIRDHDGHRHSTDPDEIAREALK